MRATVPPRHDAADVTAAIACILALWWAFIVGQRVPLLSYVDLGFHELGHLLFAWAPGLVPPLAGSVTQVGVPLGLALYFGFVRRETFAAALLLAWTATSAQNVSVYVVDAPYQVLPFLGNGVHDWAYIFSSLGHMEWAAPVADGVRLFGVAAVLLGLGLALYPLVARRFQSAGVPGYPKADPSRLSSLPRHEPRNATLSTPPLRDAAAPRPWRVGGPH